MPVAYITHNGQKILYVDLSESKSETRSFELLEETKEAYLNATEKLLVLVNTEGAYVNSNVSARMKEYGKLYFKDGAKRRAYVGIHGLKKLIFKAYTKIVGGDVKIFEDLESAKEYLVS